MKEQLTKRGLARVALLTAAVMMLLVVSPALAEKNKEDKTNQRSVTGLVTDKAENPIDGAVVQLKDLKTLQIRSFITKANGEYHFYSLSTDTDYELKADSQGKSSNTRTLSSFDSRKQAQMNLKIDK
jgi:hypothetical protein